jgi:hypothetical protein
MIEFRYEGKALEIVCLVDETTLITKNFYNDYHTVYFTRNKTCASFHNNKVGEVFLTSPYEFAVALDKFARDVNNDYQQGEYK